MAQFSRRQALGVGIGAVAASRFSPALAEGDTPAPAAHGMSAFGDLKYPADFPQFDYVNVKAPKGGVFSTIPSARAFNQSYQTFNSLNAFVLRGDGAQGMGMTF
ncbi:MAG: ABC transporter substrate-binding protein, partial [Tardiphaga sp.]